MTDTFEISSPGGPARFELAAGEKKRTFHASVRDEGLSASSEVSQIGGGDGFHEFWADLATNWRGWSDPKVWKSLEGDLKLSASVDRTGHVQVTITLRHYCAWSAEILVVIEAGQLESVAGSALDLCRRLGAAA